MALIDSQGAEESEMGCWHGWHGCGSSYGAPYRRGWYQPVEWDEEVDWPMRRRRRGPDQEVRVDELEARLERLREEVRTLEGDLVRLRATGPAAGER